VDQVREQVAQAHQLSAARIIPIRKGTLLRTTSGKVRRRSIKHAWQEQQLHVVHEEVVVNQAPSTDQNPAISPAVLEHWLKQQSADILGTISARNIEVDTSLFSYGFDSMNAATLLASIQKHWQVQLPENALFDHPTINTLSQHILNQRNPDSQPAASQSKAPSTQSSDDIAIIGMAFRFPGTDQQEAQTDQQFWDLLVEGQSAIRPMPSERFRRDDSIPGFGGFLNRPADFDAAFFDSSITSLHGKTISRLLGSRDLIKYLNQRIKEMKSSPATLQREFKSLPFNGTSAEVIELCYALYKSKKINADLKQIITAFSLLFDMDLKNFHQSINNMKARKGERAKFMNLLKTAFESALEED
jgi:acyl carrier protein